MQVVTWLRSLLGLYTQRLLLTPKFCSCSVLLLWLKKSILGEGKVPLCNGNPIIYDPNVLYWRELYKSLMPLIKYGYSWYINYLFSILSIFFAFLSIFFLEAENKVICPRAGSEPWKWVWMSWVTLATHPAEHPAFYKFFPFPRALLYLCHQDFLRDSGRCVKQPQFQDMNYGGRKKVVSKK